MKELFMVLRTKIVGITVGSIVLTVTAGLLIQRSVIRNQGIEALRGSMRTTILSAESTRRSVSQMRSERMFDDAKLKADAAKTSDYRQTSFYKTVPVVAAWNSIIEVAAKEGYEFRVAARSPRNSKNAPKPEEEQILNAIDKDRLAEYFAVNESANEIVFARPIRLTGDCLACHGDPGTSPNHNGKDALGFPMEGWREGDQHGIFLLRSKLDRVDAVVRAGMGQTIVWLLPLSVLIGLGVHLLITGITKKLSGLIEAISESSAQVTSAVVQISESSQGLAQGASEQSASLEETSSASEEITIMTKKNAEHSRTASEEMARVDQQVKDSNLALDQMASSMSDIKTSSGKISKIIKIIDEIAFQTNILALNAAVEAARAGASGAGFAVVADEVRNLAQRSAQAAKDTAPLIEDSIARSNEGSLKLEQVVRVIHSISDSAGKVKVLVDQVNSGSREQSRGIEQVSNSIQQMNVVTQSNAASSEENAAASQQLAAQAESMKAIARDLRVLVEG